MMTIDDIVAADASIRTTIQKWVRDDNFDAIKDFFIENVPGGENGQEKDALLCQGRYLATRFIFKELKRIATQKPAPKPKDKDASGIDPDLQES